MITAVVAVGLHTLPTTAIIVMSIAHRYLQQKNENLSILVSYPLRGSIALLQAQSCAHFIYTLPTSLKGRRLQGSRSLRGFKKSEKLSFLASVPPQVVPEVAQSAYNRDFRPLHVSWCVKNVLVRTPREIHGFPGTNIVNFL